MKKPLPFPHNREETKIENVELFPPLGFLVVSFSVVCIITVIRSYVSGRVLS